MTSITANITIRDLNVGLYRKVKSKAVESGKKIAEATAEAYELWLSHANRKKTGKSFLDLFDHPNDWGIKTDSSEDLDKYIYA